MGTRLLATYLLVTEAPLYTIISLVGYICIQFPSRHGRLIIHTYVQKHACTKPTLCESPITRRRGRMEIMSQIGHTYTLQCLSANYNLYKCFTPTIIVCIQTIKNEIYFVRRMSFVCGSPTPMYSARKKWLTETRATTHVRCLRISMTSSPQCCFNKFYISVTVSNGFHISSNSFSLLTKRRTKPISQQ